MNTTNHTTTLEIPTSSYNNTESTTVAAVARQSSSFLIPVSVLLSVALFAIVGAICFYMRKRRHQKRRKPLPLPNPYPESEMLVRYRSVNTEENDPCLDDHRILIQPSPTEAEFPEAEFPEAEFPEQSPFCEMPAEPIYENEPTSQESPPIYENCDASFYTN